MPATLISCVIPCGPCLDRSCRPSRSNPVVKRCKSTKVRWKSSKYGSHTQRLLSLSLFLSICLKNQKYYFGTPSQRPYRHWQKDLQASSSPMGAGPGALCFVCEYQCERGKSFSRQSCFELTDFNPKDYKGRRLKKRSIFIDFVATGASEAGKAQSILPFWL